MEYRLCWAASSNISFRGETDWEPWDGDGDTEDDVSKALSRGAGGIPEGLEMVLDASGFEWWVETRGTADV